MDETFYLFFMKIYYDSTTLLENCGDKCSENQARDLSSEKISLFTHTSYTIEQWSIFLYILQKKLKEHKLIFEEPMGFSFIHN